MSAAVGISAAWHGEFQEGDTPQELYERNPTVQYFVDGTMTNYNYATGKMSGEEYWGEKKAELNEAVVKPAQHFLENGFSFKVSPDMNLLSQEMGLPPRTEHLTHYMKTDQELQEMGELDNSVNEMALGAFTGGAVKAAAHTTKGIADRRNGLADNNNSDSDNRNRVDIDLNNDRESADPIRTGKLLTNTKSLFDILSELSVVGLFMRQMTESALSRAGFERVAVSMPGTNNVQYHFIKTGGAGNKKSGNSIKNVENVPGWTGKGGAKNYAYGEKGFKPGETRKPSRDGTIVTDVMDKSGKIKVGEIHKNQPVKNGSGGKYYPEHFQYYNHKTGKTNSKQHYY